MPWVRGTVPPRRGSTTAICTGLARMASTASGHVLTASHRNRSGSRERSRKRRSAGTAARSRCRKTAPICRKKGLNRPELPSQIKPAPDLTRQSAERESHVPPHDEVALLRSRSPRHPLHSSLHTALHSPPAFLDDRRATATCR